MRLSAELFRRILDAAPRENHRVSLFAAHFDGTIFEGEAGFGEAIFRGDAVFEGATFEGDAMFSGATFEAWVGFAGATFRRGAEFVATTFDGGTQFEEAIFQGGAVFERAVFHGGAVLARVTFQGEVWFKEATFRSEVWFDEVTFRSEVWFSGATFEGGIRFEEAIFQREAGFGGVIFEGEAWFYQAIFQSKIRFDGATFRRGAWFDGATFEVEAGFIQVTFQGGIGFGGVIFQEQASFEEATFERARQVGPLLANQLVLDDAVFYERVQLDVAATALYARRAQFRDGVQFRLRWASVVLDDANLAAPAILAGVPFFPGLDEQAAASQWEQLPPGPRDQRWRPRLLSLCRADVAGLRVANVDLRPCRFIGAHNLDKFRIEGAPLFARTRGWWRARRKTLAEEQHWRANRAGRWRQRYWYPPTCQPPAATDELAVLTPAQLAALYRELRKGREDAKDEPGAADFYYGEMEMRRCDHATPWVERLVLWLYWLVSGYALRAWRALTVLAVVVLLAGVAFALWGFPSSESGFRAVRVDARGALVYQRQPAGPPPGVQRLPLRSASARGRPPHCCANRIGP